MIQRQFYLCILYFADDFLFVSYFIFVIVFLFLLIYFIFVTLLYFLVGKGNMTVGVKESLQILMKIMKVWGDQSKMFWNRKACILY